MVWLFIRIISFAKIPVLSLTLTETYKITGAGGGGGGGFFKKFFMWCYIFSISVTTQVRKFGKKKHLAIKFLANNDPMWWLFLLEFDTENSKMFLHFQ